MGLYLFWDGIGLMSEAFVGVILDYIRCIVILNQKEVNCSPKSNVPNSLDRVVHGLEVPVRIGL